MIETFLIGLFFAFVQLKDRVFVAVPFVNSEMPILEFALVLVAAGFALYRFSFLLNALRANVALLWMPYLLLSGVLPILGVALMSYGITSVYASLVGMWVPLAAMVIGAATFIGKSQRKEKVIHYLLNAGVILQFSLSVLQFLRLMGFSNPLIALVAEWDITSQARFKEEYVLVGRSIGTYINPNILGVWALGAFFWNLVCGKGAPRVIFCTLSVATLLLSQSRSAAVALLVAAAAYVLRAMLPDRLAKEGLRAIVMTSFLIVVGVITLAFVVPDFSVLPGFERWQGGVNVVTRGTQADANLFGRIEVWRESIGFMREYPLGTFGPPQVLFLLPPDNQYVYLLLQGSVPLVFCFILGLVGSISLIFKPSKDSVLVGVFAICLATNSVTALPLLYAPGVLFWFFLGCYLSREALAFAPQLSFERARIEPTGLPSPSAF